MPTAATRSLLDVLHDVLTVPSASTVDFAIALDWYMTPIEHMPAADWPRTFAADLVHRGKYWYMRNSRIEQLRACGLALVDLLHAVIIRHPLLMSVDAVASVPGHDSRRVSFGARLADAVARRLNKPLVRCSALAEFRTEAKSLAPADLTTMIDNQFVCPANLAGKSLLIVDDVYRSGITVGETARALRAAGGMRVSCLSAVRTMRTY
jgi:predicted amidophosphoribosyltransferase